MDPASVEADDGRKLWSMGHENALEQDAPFKGCVAKPVGAIHRIGIRADGQRTWPMLPRVGSSRHQPHVQTPFSA